MRLTSNAVAYYSATTTLRVRHQKRELLKGAFIYGSSEDFRHGMTPKLANENAVNGLKLNRSAVTIATQAKTRTHTHINLNWVVVRRGGDFSLFV